MAVVSLVSPISTMPDRSANPSVRTEQVLVRPVLMLVASVVVVGCAHSPPFESPVPYIEIPRKKLVVFPVKTMAYEIRLWDGPGSKSKRARALASIVVPEVERLASRSGSWTTRRQRSGSSRAWSGH